MEELLLERNIYYKKLELIHIIEWDTAQSSSPHNPFCDLKLKLQSVLQPTITSSSVPNQQQLEINHITYINGFANVCQQYMTSYSRQQQFSYDTMPGGVMNGNNNNYGCPNPTNKFEYHHRTAAVGTVYPVYSNKSNLSNTKKVRSIKKSSFGSKGNSNVTVDYTQVHVYLEAIELSVSRPKTLDGRKFLESVIYTKELIADETYNLPAIINAAGHFDYTVRSLSVEMSFFKTMIQSVQQRCDDFMFMQLYREEIKNFSTAANMLIVVNGRDIFRDINNTETIAWMNDILTVLIRSIRDVGIICTIAAQRLLIKETSAVERRRKINIGF